MSIFTDKLVLIEGSGSFSWKSSPVSDDWPLSIQVLSPLPPGIFVIAFGARLQFFGVAQAGITGNWPVRLRVTDSVAAVFDLTFPIEFLPASAPPASSVNAPALAQGAFYYALCGGPLCKESANG